MVAENCSFTVSNKITESNTAKATLGNSWGTGGLSSPDRRGHEITER